MGAAVTDLSELSQALSHVGALLDARVQNRFQTGSRRAC